MLTIDQCLADGIFIVPNEQPHFCYPVMCVVFRMRYSILHGDRFNRCHFLDGQHPRNIEDDDKTTIDARHAGDELGIDARAEARRRFNAVGADLHYCINPIDQ